MVSEEYVRAIEQEMLRKSEQVKELLSKCAEMKEEIGRLKQQLEGHKDGCNSA